jgi:hypothetical protein
MMNYLWLIGIACTHAMVYMMGKRDGMEEMPDEDAWIEVKKYEADKRFEHLRWLEERKNHHDA